MVNRTVRLAEQEIKLKRTCKPKVPVLEASHRNVLVLKRVRRWSLNSVSHKRQLQLRHKLPHLTSLKL